MLKKKDSFAVGLDGSFFLFMGGSGIVSSIRGYDVRLDGNLKISKDATHLSFFYGLPYYSTIFPNSYEPFIDRTALDVFVDGDLLLRISNLNINKSMYSGTNRYYYPMNIDIRRYADGGNHSLKFYFTEAKDPSKYDLDGNPSDPYGLGTDGQIMFIDYIQTIKSNCTLYIYINKFHFNTHYLFF